MIAAGYNIDEVDVNGYIYDRTYKSKGGNSYNTDIKSKNILLSLYDTIKNLFIITLLPINYEKSVRKEYLQYQYYDSIQGLCSYVRSVLTVRSLLIGAGVGNISKSATSAALAWAFKDGIGMIATLILAYTSARSFEVYVKEWRFLADVLNNIALTIDLANHFLIFFSKNEFHYALLLAVSSLFKCFCGLIAGATKARISNHFAMEGCLADVTTKESSQETVVALIGLILGGIITKYFGDSDIDALFIFFILTAIHFWANYKLTKTLVFDTLNPQRCWLITKYMIEHKNVLVQSPDDIRNKESLFRPIYLSYFGPQIGVSINTILNTLEYIKGVEPKVTINSTKKVLETSWKTLTDCFKDEHFIIGIDKNERIVICISHTAQNDDSILLRAYMMGCFLQQTWSRKGLTVEKTTKKIRIANLYSSLINADAKRCFNWYNHITASSQKGGMVKANTALFPGWNTSKNQTKLGEGSLRYKNKVMRSAIVSASIPDEKVPVEKAPPVKEDEKVPAEVETKETVGLRKNVSWSDLGIYSPASPIANRISSDSIDMSSETIEPTVAELLLTYSGTSLVLDTAANLFGSPSKSTDENTWRETPGSGSKDIVEEKFSKGEEKLL